MIRHISSVVAGLLTAFVIIAMVEWVNSLLFPLPETIDTSDYEALSVYMQDIPGGALLMVLLAYLTGTTGGAWIATVISRGLNWPAMLIGSMLMGAGLFNVLMISHPAWFVIGTVIVFLPAAFLGYVIAHRTHTF